MTIKNLLFITSTSLFLTACSVGPDYHAPKTEVSAAWSTSERAEQTISKTAPLQIDWWQALKDPALTSLIEQAAQQNLDIKIAQARIKEARAHKLIQAADRYPTVTGTTDFSREGISENIGQPITPENPSNRNFYNMGFDASYELDFFGGVGRSVEAARARLSSAEENKRDVLLSIVAETARNYTELRGVQQRIAITSKNIALQQKTVDLVKRRYEAGLSNNFELSRAEARLRATEAALPNLTADMRAYIYRLGLLTGSEPQTLLTQLSLEKPLPILPDLVPVGLRSDILQRRPDIRRAERELAAATADIGVATSNLFPKFFLTGNAGVSTMSFSTLFDSTSTAWALGPLIQWPIFRGGQIRAQIRSEEAQAETAAYQYEQAILTALNDVETALVRYGEELETQDRFSKAVTANKHAVYLAKRRYEAGEDDLIALIDAERELAEIEDNYVRSQTRSITHLISLYKALGGGWEVFEPTENQ